MSVCVPLPVPRVQVPFTVTWSPWLYAYSLWRFTSDGVRRPTLHAESEILRHFGPRRTR